ncbi:hypothetical protein CPT_Seifer_074 [Klebsiella phage Seifer]|uniref:Uncharacterized protein n=1 Tax=Klebsiella phage Seifer TaxID=2315475 RepID=A0A3B8DHZ3_9CAUD|nr:hypothetical protein HWB88_gp74 [Klebsiella phage Seifer]AYJ72856.1 hypothetical protein CPT_Seifer_074 [Klebsiella phage Seifer]
MANPSHVIKTDGAYGRRAPPHTVKCYGHTDESVIALARRYYEKEHGGRVAVIRTADGRALYQTNQAAHDEQAADENE